MVVPCRRRPQYTSFGGCGWLSLSLRLHHSSIRPRKRHHDGRSAGSHRKIFLGIEYPPVEIEKAVQLANNGQIGSPVQQFLLLCYCYNPLTGPYGFLIFTLLKVGAALTVLALAAFIIMQLRRESSRKAVT